MSNAPDSKAIFFAALELSTPIRVELKRPLRHNPSEWLMAQVLYREAQQVLGEPAGAEPTVLSAADVQE
jgi:hypothetical protein